MGLLYSKLAGIHTVVYVNGFLGYKEVGILPAASPLFSFPNWESCLFKLEMYPHIFKSHLNIYIYI